MRKTSLCLDDKNFLVNLRNNWDSEENSKHFLFSLLKCRVLFDRFIIKREFVKDYKEQGKWSLQRLKSYKDGNRSWRPTYVGTFNGEDNKNKHLRTLQSCLRITYTSPKTMHWISLALKDVMDDKGSNLIEILEKYCKDKIKSSKYESASGFNFERIVFTYLDYVLYRDGYSYKKKLIISPFKDDWQFQFRNSIEHFHPQNPVEGERTLKWGQNDLNAFGNLALITVSGNSKFSNLLPNSKVNSYSSVIQQSLKLKIMDQMMILNGGKWDQEVSEKHKDEMFNILSNELSK